MKFPMFSSFPRPAWECAFSTPRHLKSTYCKSAPGTGHKPQISKNLNNTPSPVAYIIGEKKLGYRYPAHPPPLAALRQTRNARENPPPPPGQQTERSTQPNRTQPTSDPTPHTQPSLRSQHSARSAKSQLRQPTLQFRQPPISNHHAPKLAEVRSQATRTSRRRVEINLQ